MIKRIIFLILIQTTSVFAAIDTTVTLSSQIADDTTSSIISLQPSFKEVFTSTDIDLSFDASKSRNDVNYNSSVDDFMIEKTSTSAGLDIIWNKIIGLGVEGSSEVVDKNQAATTGVSKKFKLKYDDFLFSLVETNFNLKQTDDYIILNVDRKDQLKMKKTHNSFTFTYVGFELITISLNYIKYKYESDYELPTLVSLLTTKNLLIKNGASYISQIYTLTDHETHLDFVYSLTDQIDFEVSFGQSIDYYDPYIKSNDLRIGSTYYFEPYNIGFGATAVKSEDSEDYFYTADINLSYNF